MKKNIMVLLLAILSVNLFSINKGIEGIYLPQDEYIGIEISTIGGGYLIQQVFVMDSVVKRKLEWQSAFIKDCNNKDLHFYWHTGRRDDNDKESNGIIAYDLESTTEGFEGFYYFPENGNGNKFEIKYIKLEI